MTTRTLSDGTRLRFYAEHDDVIAEYLDLPADATNPGKTLVYALLGEHGEASRSYVSALAPYRYGTDPRLDDQVDRITSILEARTETVRYRND